jgi:succinoglycan biosynthesis protein ExoM
VLGAGNVLLRRAIVADQAMMFDPNFGRTGSEDTDFFRRLHAKGRRIIACRSAIVKEIVPLSRLTTSSLARRYRRNGQVEAQQMLDGPTSAARLIMTIAKSTIRVGLCACFPLMMPFGPYTLGFRFFRHFWYNVGIIDFVIGRKRLFMEE